MNFREIVSFTAAYLLLLLFESSFGFTIIYKFTFIETEPKERQNKHKQRRPIHFMTTYRERKSDNIKIKLFQLAYKNAHNIIQSKSN